MDAALGLQGLSKRFPDHLALDGLTLEVPEGELFTLVGPSGCGKTTTLRLIAGFETPTAGDIFLQGQSIRHLKPFERNVSTVFQSYALFPHLNVRQNIEFGLRYRKQADHSRVSRLIEMLQLAGKEDRLPGQLSGGERQRVALARSLVLEPKVLLLDEPLAALDPILRKQVRTELRALQRKVGITFLFITHDQEEALSISDRIAVLNRGRLEQTGTPREVYLHPKTRFVAGFLGPVNWVNGVGIRPEATRLAHQPPDSNVKSIPAKVEGSLFLGNCLHVETKLSSGEAVVAEVSRLNGVFERGQDVHVWWHDHDELALPPG